MVGQLIGIRGNPITPAHHNSRSNTTLGKNYKFPREISHCVCGMQTICGVIHKDADEKSAEDIVGNGNY